MLKKQTMVSGKLLAIDTTMSACSVSVADVQTRLCASRSEQMVRGHAESLVPMIDDLLHASGISYTEICAVAVTRGPGAFTGMRIGLATARALGVGLGVPVLGLTTHAVLAEQVRCNYAPGETDIIGVLIDTKRDDLYTQFFDAGAHPSGAPDILSYEDVAKHLQHPTTETGQNPPGTFLLAGDADMARLQAQGTLPGKEVCIQVCGAVVRPDTDRLALMALDLSAGSDFQVQEYPPEPLYIRGAKTSISDRPARALENIKGHGN